MHKDGEQVATLGDLLDGINEQVGGAAFNLLAFDNTRTIRARVERNLFLAQRLTDTLRQHLSVLGLLNHPAGQAAEPRTGWPDEILKLADGLGDGRRTGLCGDGTKPLVGFETDCDPADEDNHEKE